jgi:hypothetical protein
MLLDMAASYLLDLSSLFLMDYFLFLRAFVKYKRYIYIYIYKCNNGCKLIKYFLLWDQHENYFIYLKIYIYKKTLSHLFSQYYYIIIIPNMPNIE